MRLVYVSISDVRKNVRQSYYLKTQEVLRKFSMAVTQEELDQIQNFRYLDDDFMTACLKDNVAAVKLIIRIILGMEDVEIISIKTQEVLKNLKGHSVILDVHAIDGSKREFDVEIQRKDRGAGARRARHNSCLLDASILKPR